MKEKMTLFSVDEILELTQGVMLQSGNAAGVCAVSIDDQNNDPGALFVPVIVPGFDTHENIPNAVKNGAVAVLTMKRDTKVPPNIVLICLENITYKTALRQSPLPNCFIFPQRIFKPDWIRSSSAEAG